MSVVRLAAAFVVAVVPAAVTAFSCPKGYVNSATRPIARDLPRATAVANIEECSNMCKGNCKGIVLHEGTLACAWDKGTLSDGAGSVACDHPFTCCARAVTTPFRSQLSQLHHTPPPGWKSIGSAEHHRLARQDYLTSPPTGSPACGGSNLQNDEICRLVALHGDCCHNVGSYTITCAATCCGVTCSPTAAPTSSGPTTAPTGPTTAPTSSAPTSSAACPGAYTPTDLKPATLLGGTLPYDAGSANPFSVCAAGCDAEPNCTTFSIGPVALAATYCFMYEGDAGTACRYQCCARQGPTAPPAPGQTPPPTPSPTTPHPTAVPSWGPTSSSPTLAPTSSTPTAAPVSSSPTSVPTMPHPTAVPSWGPTSSSPTLAPISSTPTAAPVSSSSTRPSETRPPTLPPPGPLLPNPRFTRLPTQQIKLDGSMDSSNAPSDNGSTSSVAGVAIGMVMCLLIIAAIIVIVIYKRRRSRAESGDKAVQQLSPDDSFNATFAPGRPDGEKPSVQATAAAKNSGHKKKEWLPLSRQLSTSSNTDHRCRRTSSDPLLEEFVDDIDDDPVEDLSRKKKFTQIREEHELAAMKPPVPSGAEIEMCTAANENPYEVTSCSVPEDTSRNQVVDQTYGDDCATVNDKYPHYEIHNPTFVAPAYRQPLNPYDGSESKTDHTLDRDVLNTYQSGGESKTDPTLGRGTEESAYNHLRDSAYHHLSDTLRDRDPPVYAASPAYHIRRDSLMYAAPEYGEVDYSAPTQPGTYDQPMAPTPGARAPKSAPKAYRAPPHTQAANAGAGPLPSEEDYAAVNYSEPTQLDQEEYAIVDYCEVDQVKTTAVPKVASSGASRSAVPPSDDAYATVDEILGNPSAPRTQLLPLSTANISSSTPPLSTKTSEAGRADVYDNGEANTALPPVDDSMYATAEAMTDPSAGLATPSQGVYRALPTRPGAIVSASSGQYAVRTRPVSGPVDGDGAGTAIYSSSPAVGDNMYATMDDTMDPTGDIYSVPNKKAKLAAALSAEDVYDNGEANSASEDIYAEAEVMTRKEGTRGVASSVLPSDDTSEYVTLDDVTEALANRPALPPKAKGAGIYATAEAMTEAQLAAPNVSSSYGFRRVSDGRNAAASSMHDSSMHDSSTGPAPQSAALVGDKKPTYETAPIRANGAPTTGTVSYEPIPSQRSSMPPLDVPRTEQEPGNGEVVSALPSQDDSIYATAEAMTEAPAGRPIPSQDVYDNGEANSALPPQDDSADVYVVRVTSDL